MRGGATVGARARRAVAALTAALTCAVAGAGLASDLDALRNEVVSLREQLLDMERVVYRDADPPPRAASGEGPPDGRYERLSRRLAVAETASDQAEEWRRHAAGRFDELENMIRRLEGRIERLVADVDVRLSALERPPEAPVGTDAPEAGAAPSAASREAGAPPPEEGEADAAPSARSAALTTGTPEERYERAFGLLQEARYEEAHDLLARFVEENPEHPRTEDAAYWRSETFYARQMFAEAARSYALNLQRFGQEGRRAPDNMVKLGLALLKDGRAEEACRTFAQLDQTFPEMPVNIRRAARQGQTQAGCP